MTTRAEAQGERLNSATARARRCCGSTTAKRWVVAAAAALVLGACSAPDDSEGGTGSDGEGIDLAVPGWTVSGNLAIDSAAQPFLDVFHVVEDQAGRAHVLNMGDKTVRVYDSVGTLVRVVGGPGEGPGEFVAPADMAVAPDGTLYVLDVGNFRVSAFGTEDGLFRSSVDLGTSAGIPKRIGIRAGTTLVVEFMPLSGVTGAMSPHLALVEGDAARVKSILDLGSAPQVMYTVTVGDVRTTTFGEQPYAPQPQWVASAAGEILYGDGAHNQILRWRDGIIDTLFREDDRVIPVTEADRKAFFAASPDLVHATPPVTFPSSKPQFTALRSDADSRLWLRTAVDEGRESWGIRGSQDGQKVGRVTLPARSRLVGISISAVYLIVLDDNDVETLRRVELTRSAHPRGT